jgi:3-hydroxyisobutyrate dehydrogenase-like beta-hydroxyacid dehydrogenase
MGMAVTRSVRPKIFDPERTGFLAAASAGCLSGKEQGSAAAEKTHVHPTVCCAGRRTMLGETGALTSLAAGTAWIDMTSNSPAAARPIQEQASSRAWRSLRHR